MNEHERFIARVTQTIENKGTSAPVAARLQELLDNARRGVELRDRFAPRTGRKFLAQRRDK